MNRVLLPGAIALAFLLALPSCGVLQVSPTPPAASSADAARHPKLIVGITVDQMRYEYLERYWNDFGEGGFRRLVNGGFVASNLHYNYMPTYTGPGHAAIFTGTTPANNGIIANDWYVRDGNFLQYCAKDPAVTGVGSTSPAAVMSPVHLKSTTLGDEMQLFSNERSVVIGIAMKDRGAILPAGRMADAAYWYIGGAEDTWATSSWYGMDVLPSWVRTFNERKLGDEYLSRGWSLFRDEAVYDESSADNTPFEAPFKGLIRPVFPYDLDSLRALNNQYDLIKATPWGNTMTVEFGKAAVLGEQMGKDAHTDMLCMSFSSTDYIGHQFGIHGREVQDCYLRLDQDLAGFLAFLDQEVGAGNYLVFLTADHGGAPTPGYTARMKGAAQYFKSDPLEQAVEDALIAEYGPGDWVVNESNQNIFLNRPLIAEKKLDPIALQMEAARVASDFPGVAEVYTHSQLSARSDRDAIAALVQNGFHQELSGDVIYTLEPGWIEYGMTGTTHGSPYAYDTHVPGIFYGYGVLPGESARYVTICDIAPTVAALCRLPLPNACTGTPILEAIGRTQR